MWEREAEDVRRRIDSYLPLMPDGAFFTGPTAAFLHALPLPRGMHETLHVGVHHPRTAPRRVGVTGVQVLPRMATVVIRDGLPFADVATTWAGLGAGMSLFDLVAVTDAILRVPRHPGGFRSATASALATKDDLAHALAAGRRRGAERLRQALDRARTGASSRPETWMRLTLVDAGLPEPVLDHDVVGTAGEFLGCSELAYPEARVAIEYESDGHLSRRQLERDIDKCTAYAEAGWRTVRLTGSHVFRTPREAVRRVTAALRDSSA